MNRLPRTPSHGGRVIAGDAIRPDTVNDLVRAKLRRFNRIPTWTGEKRRLREELGALCTRHGYVGFQGDPRDYAAHLVGQSFLYDVPSDKRGWLERFRGKRVRIICLYSGSFRRWLRVGVVDEAPRAEQGLCSSVSSRPPSKSFR